MEAITQKRLATMEAKTRAAKRNRGTGEPGVSNAAQGYPAVSSQRQQVVLDALVAVGKPASVTEITTEGGFNKSTAQNALAHLRARGLVRWAGKKGSGHLYAPYDEATADAADEVTE